MANITFNKNTLYIPFDIRNKKVMFNITSPATL